METYWIADAWKQKFKEEKLDTLTRLLMHTEGLCLSMHSRGSTFVSKLSDDPFIFIKRDHFTLKKDMLPDLLHFRAPVPKSIHEWRIFQRLKEMGFTVPEVIAAGYRRSFGLATVGGIVMLPLEGMALNAYIAAEQDEHRREYAINCCRDLLQRLQEKGIDWPDCKAEHFILMKNNTIGLLDLERVTFHGKPLADARCQKQFKSFNFTIDLALEGNISVHTRSEDAQPAQN